MASKLKGCPNRFKHDDDDHNFEMFWMFDNTWLSKSVFHFVSAKMSPGGGRENDGTLAWQLESCGGCVHIEQFPCCDFIAISTDTAPMHMCAFVVVLIVMVLALLLIFSAQM